MSLHERGDIDDAIAEAQKAIELDPAFAEALSYLGSTLVQRKGQFTDGLEYLAKAVDAAPDDPSIHYTAGWCCEFVAHRVGRRPRPGLDPGELYARAEQHLRRCLELGPDGKMRDDAKDLLSAILREDVE